MVLPQQPDLQGLQDLPVLRVLQDLRDLPALGATLALRDLRDLPVLGATLALRVAPAIPGPKEIRVQRARGVPKVGPARPGRTALRALRGQRVLLALRVPPDLQGLRDRPGCRCFGYVCGAHFGASRM
jgi:hypothetical protein